MNISFLNFLTLLIYKHKSKHFAIFLLFTLIVMLLSSVLFISSSIQKDINLTLEKQADFTVSKIRAGRVVDTPLDWADEFSEILGVSKVNPRVYGQYWFEPNEYFFTIIGVDFYDEQSVKSLQNLLEGIDLKEFMKRDHMIVGDGVKKILDSYHYREYYNFRPPDRSIKKVYIYDQFPNSINIVSSDSIIMDIDLAREILGVSEDMATDIVLNVPNEAERDSVKVKLIISHFDMRIIEKQSIERAYKNMFNYKGGVFLSLYIVVILTFILILYQRYSIVSSSDKKEIGILRAVGWSIKDVIKLKLYESLIISVGAFVLGFVLAYIFVYYFNAPLLSSIFLGFQNLPLEVSFTPSISFGLFALLFLFFIIPFVAAVLIPVWRIAITDASEAMR